MNYLKLLVFLLPSLLPALASARESGPGNGTDYVKVLFAEAQFELNRALLPLENTTGLALSEPVRRWLDAEAGGLPRFAGLKRYVRTMELRFQTAPCSDGSGRPASICYFTDDGDYVVISLAENRNTTRDQAMAMLVHEAGHFVGEKDHLFLDRVGVELRSALGAPVLLVGEASAAELAGNVFQAKDECEAGTSSLALRARKEAELALGRAAAERSVALGAGTTEYLFHGEPEFAEGRGFTMKVSCAVKAVWRKR